MSAKLVSLGEGSNIPVDRPILVIGRSPECDFVLDSKKVSRQHCCLARVNDYLVVRDLGSTNGVRVNGLRIEESKVLSGDELTIGNHRFRLDMGIAADKGHEKVSDEQLSLADNPIPLSESHDSAAQRISPPGEPSEPDDSSQKYPAKKSESGWIGADSKFGVASLSDSDIKLKSAEDG